MDAFTVATGLSGPAIVRSLAAAIKAAVRPILSPPCLISRRSIAKTPKPSMARWQIIECPRSWLRSHYSGLRQSTCARAPPPSRTGSQPAPRPGTLVACARGPDADRRGRPARAAPRSRGDGDAAGFPGLPARDVRVEVPGTKRRSVAGGAAARVNDAGRAAEAPGVRRGLLVHPGRRRAAASGAVGRSEERRVGKECR